MTNPTFDERVKNARILLQSRDSALEKAKDEKVTDPKKDEKITKETPKNDEYNEYDYSDNENADDKDW